MGCLRLVLPLVAAALALPGQALADWGENWGSMLWSSAGTAVPALDWLGLLILGTLLAATAGWLLRRRVGWVSALLVVLAIPAVVVASSIEDIHLHVFTDGTPAVAGEVNANFDTVQAAVNDNDARIGAAQSAAETAQSVAEAADTKATAATTAAAAAAAGHTVDTTLDEAAVDAFVGNNGYSTGAHSVDTTLDEAAVDAFVANNGFALEADVSANATAIAALGAATGLEACPDGVTVADHDTGLLWEKKTGTIDVSGQGVPCETAGCPDPHDVRNSYTWSSDAAYGPDGDVFTDFLAKLNDSSQPAIWMSDFSSEVVPRTSGCFADHCDWRLPNAAEILTIVASGSCEPCGEVCEPCIDPLFGTTQPNFYWSATSMVSLPVFAHGGGFMPPGSGGGGIKTSGEFSRAVRKGSCTD